jgi:hypothetical protein
MKRCVLAVLVAGCASGSNATQSDALTGGGHDAPVHVDSDINELPDAPIDAEPHIDAAIDAMPHPDAPPVDAPPPIDAAPPVDAPIDACVPVVTELLANPALDLSPAGTMWTQVPIDPTYPPITSDGFTAHTAPYKAWMGGITGEDEGVSTVTDQIYQDVTVPANTTQLVLTGYYVVGTNETGTTVYDTASVDLQQTNGSPIENVMSLNNTTTTASAWQPFSHTFTANVSGQAVRLRITSTNDITLGTNFFFDTLSLKATHCP